MTTTATRVTRKAIMVSPLFTVLDGHESDPMRSVRPTPTDTWSAGLGALLDRLAPQFDRQGVVLLDRSAIRSLGLPLGPGDRPVPTAGIDSARAAGWLSGKPGPWTVFYADGRPTIVVGLTSWPDFYRAPITFAASSVDTVYRLSLWHKLTGSAWRGTPGVAGLTVLRETVPTFKSGNRNLRPSFRYVDGPDDAAELDFRPNHWSRPQTMPWAHGYDASRMYLAAAGVCEQLSPWALKHTGRRAFDPKLAGWWRVKLGPWQDDRIPAPAGPGEAERWVTTPTLSLLAELAHRGGPFQTFDLLDSFTAPGKRVLRNWSERLESTYQTARSMAELPREFGPEQDAEAVRSTVKLAYAEAWGLLNREGNAVYRPDWHFAILAQARANLWRKVWAVGLTEDRWPLEINVDNVWYESADDLATRAKPDGIPLLNAHHLTDALGTFKCKGSRERGKA